jgi:hypothetical protein
MADIDHLEPQDVACQIGKCPAHGEPGPKRLQGRRGAAGHYWQRHRPAALGGERVAQCKDHEPGGPGRDVHDLSRHHEPGRAGHWQGQGVHHPGRGWIIDANDLKRP